MQTLTLGNTAVRLHDGLYSLNDLHKAASGEKKHEPHQFMWNDQTVALIEEIHSAYSRSAAKTINGGQNRGTYVCRELVYAYAMWISSKFNLQVIRAFDALTAGAQLAASPANLPALAARRRIRSRDDLSMTARDSDGHRLNWFVPDRRGQYRGTSQVQNLL